MKLDDVRVPEGAEERAWRVVRTAFEERESAPRERHLLRPALVLVAVAVLAGVLASPPGQSVIRSIREAVGVEKAAKELFSLPTPGRLLVESPKGPWVVSADGSRRLLGPYRQAAWSPFGRYVVATRRDELVTMDPQGHVHWTLARPAVASPSWGGTRTDTRIAYLSNHVLRVVAGDGTGDHPVCGGVIVGGAPVWKPGSLEVIAYPARDGGVTVFDAARCQPLWHGPAEAVPVRLEWSTDGKRLLAFAPHGLRVYDLHGRVVAQDDPSDATHDADATFIGGTPAVVAIRLAGSPGQEGSNIFRLGNGRTLFSVGGALYQVLPSPDGRWLLVTAPAADQWIFVRVRGARRIVAVSGITRQFGGGSFPHVSGWVGK